ncbi:MAG: DNA polymerase I [Lachnospiraceae bacterium]|nr:DNA polymerase I [Lachnospiraceae bacterium]
MSEKIVLIDGHSILNRAFYGVPDLTNSEGLHTNAVYGFLNIMLKILEEEKPQYLVVAFDRKEPTFRHERYKEYKGTRKPMPEELHQQVPVIQEVLSAMGIPVVTQAGIEADDILGTIATNAQREGMEVSLVSGDRDLLQLASDKILIRVPKTKRSGTEIENYHGEDVAEKYGVTPAQIIDMKGLMGDSSDNIPGVPGVGEKTAVKILAAFPTVEEAYEHIEEVEPKRARELLRANKDLAFLSKELATIKTDCDVPFSLEEARYENIFTEEAYAWIKKLELKSLEKRFGAEVVSSATMVEADISTIVEKKMAEKHIQALLREKPGRVGVGFLADEWSNGGAVKKKASKKSAAQLSLVFDQDDLSLSVGEETEENGEPEYDFLGMSLAYQGETPVVLCFLVNEKLSGEDLLALYRQVEEAVPEVDVLDWKDVMHHTTPVEVLAEGREAKNQNAFLDDSQEQREVLFGKVFDVSIAAYLLNPLKNSYHVEDIARDYLGTAVASFEEVFGKNRLAEFGRGEEFQELLAHPDGELGKSVVSYLGNLAYVPVMAASSLKEDLEREGMHSLMEEIEMPTAYYLYQMERVGVQVEKKELEEISKMLESKVLALETDIYDLAGEEFNINSPKQLGVILFEKMKLPFAKKTKTGYSTSAEILEKLRNEDPIVAKILDYRQVSKLKSTYADGLPVFIETDRRIHGKFNQTITATGRISSTEPNLQNIPIRMELGREIRKVFQPREGCVFLDADYSQIELRVLAHMAGDEEMIAAYRNGQDIHRSTAAKVFHTPFDQVTDLQRRNAKAVNFGIVYGISSFGLSQDLNIPKKEAQEYIDQYFAMYPAVKEFIDQLVADAKEKKYAETLFHRKRPVPELASGNFMQRSFGERVAMNSPIQGTAADIIKLAMIRVAGRLKRENLQAKIVLQVHDELLVETPMEEREQVRRILLEEMPKVMELSVPLEVEVSEGGNWKEAH